MAAYLSPRVWAHAASVAALVLGLVQPVSAQAQADPWNIAREKVELGEPVIFLASDAPRQTGLLQSISPEGLTVLVAGQVMQIRREDVSKLWKKGDSKLNGFLIGTGIAAVGISPLFYIGCGGTEGDCGPGSVLGFALVAGLGGVVGLGVDGMIDGKTLVYKRPAGVVIAPIVTPDRAGVQARLAW